VKGADLKALDVEGSGEVSASSLMQSEREGEGKSAGIQISSVRSKTSKCNLGGGVSTHHLEKKKKWGPCEKNRLIAGMTWKWCLQGNFLRPSPAGKLLGKREL